MILSGCALHQVCLEKHRLGRLPSRPPPEPAGPAAEQRQRSLWGRRPDQRDLLHPGPRRLHPAAQERG